MNAAALQRTILEVLRDVSPNMIPQKRLHSEVIVASGEAITSADLAFALTALQAAEDGGPFVTGITLSSVTRWKITAAGLARLAD